MLDIQSEMIGHWYLVKNAEPSRLFFGNQLISDSSDREIFGNSWKLFMPPKKTALCFKDLTVQQWEELMQEYIAQHSSTGDAGSEGMEVDVDDSGEVAKHCWELEGSQVVIWEKGKKKVKAKQVETSKEEGDYLGTDELVATQSDRLL
ncbi:hypothetical protein P691DRAFT_789328 [Macrolepiota fuliginosa MF-IS2]|uniref:Uncharacterized protein n=1 Tax=Macrolepiota fuliginosa MF-IS2 TaxID=1400762 RepID=A0A9P5X1F8_9AGAR|nr:hypothetical protein P691DRAFT_789328 [Macrolepiota fuliginosa MF-IS2]